jgi:hypothetical protein
VKDGSENPFMKRSAIKDCNEQPDPKLRGGTTKQSGGTRPNYFWFQTCDFFKQTAKIQSCFVPSRRFGIGIGNVNKKLVWVAKIL